MDKNSNGIKILYLINIISGIVYFISISEWMVSSVLFSFGFGLALGLGEYFFFTRINPKTGKIVQYTSIVLGSLLSLLAACSFYSTWITSINVMKTVVTKVFSDYSQGLMIISIILGILSMPFTICLLRIIPYIFKLIGTFSFKQIWQDLKGKSKPLTIVKKIGIAILNVLGATALGTLFLFGAYLIPVQRIDKNVTSSAYTIDEEGLCPSLFGWCTSKLDNFTDAIMLLEAGNPVYDSPVNDSMNIPRGCIDDLDPVDVITDHYVRDVDFDSTTTYSSYWHGYLFILKPLLMVFDYSAIRIINGIIQLLLAVITCILLYKKGHKKAVIPYAVSYLMLMPLAMASTMQFSNCFYIFTILSIVLLLMKDKALTEKAYLVFLWAGILTPFFDLMTYPITTFGIPMVFFLLISGNITPEAKLSHTIRNAFYWCFGFGTMWLSKWTVASLITGENKFSEALAKVMQRTSTVSDEGEKYSSYTAVIRNYGAFLLTPVTILAILLIVFMLIKFIKNRNLSGKEAAKVFFPFALTGLAPVVWYVFATNHSTIHYWFANKACLVSLLAVLFGLVYLLKVNADKKEAALKAAF